MTIFAPKAAEPEAEALPDLDKAAPVQAEVSALEELEPQEPEPVAKQRMRYSYRPETAFHRYWREVAHSFVRDFRHFLGAFQTQTAPDGKVLFMKKYDLKRDLMAPVSRWLSRPVNFKPEEKDEAKTRQAGRGTF